MIDFAPLMTPFDPFEGRPHVAVAVSGGADSLALCLLAADWAANRGGRVTALTVDHGLRPEAGAEAAAVAAQLGGRGINYETLVWRGAKPATGVPAAARAARYTLMENWCRAQGVLHLLVGHHRGDQAETFRLRQRAGSADFGLAAMSAISERRSVRLLRPLLAVDRADLEHYLCDHGLGWIDDPSNRDRRYARTRIRAELAADPAAVGDALRDIKTRARRRQVTEQTVHAVLAAAVRLCDYGAAWLDENRLAAVPDPIFQSVVGRVLACVGGRAFGPGTAPLGRLCARLRHSGFAGATLAGCRIEARRDGFLIARERRNLPDPVALEPGDAVHWDGRYGVALPADWPADLGPLAVAPLGQRGWRYYQEAAAPRPAFLPSPAVAAVLPAIWRGSQLISVPSLRFLDDGTARRGVTCPQVGFKPRNPLSFSGFFLA